MGSAFFVGIDSTVNDVRWIPIATGTFLIIVAQKLARWKLFYYGLAFLIGCTATIWYISQRSPDSLKLPLQLFGLLLNGHAVDLVLGFRWMEQFIAKVLFGLGFFNPHAFVVLASEHQPLDPTFKLYLCSFVAACGCVGAFIAHFWLKSMNLENDPIADVTVWILVAGGTALVVYGSGPTFRITGFALVLPMIISVILSEFKIYDFLHQKWNGIWRRVRDDDVVVDVDVIIDDDSDEHDRASREALLKTTGAQRTLPRRVTNGKAARSVPELFETDEFKSWAFNNADRIKVRDYDDDDDDITPS